MKSTKGEKVELVLDKIGEKVGIPQQIISDKGSDLYKGIKLYQEKHQEIKHSHDITHQMALLLKKELEAGEEYEEFAKKMLSNKTTNTANRNRIFDATATKKQVKIF